MFIENYDELPLTIPVYLYRHITHCDWLIFLLSFFSYSTPVVLSVACVGMMQKAPVTFAHPIHPTQHFFVREVVLSCVLSQTVSKQALENKTEWERYLSNFLTRVSEYGDYKTIQHGHSSDLTHYYHALHPGRTLLLGDAAVGVVYGSGRIVVHANELSVNDVAEALTRACTITSSVAGCSLSFTNPASIDNLIVVTECPKIRENIEKDVLWMDKLALRFEIANSSRIRGNGEGNVGGVVEYTPEILPFTLVVQVPEAVLRAAHISDLNAKKFLAGMITEIPSSTVTNSTKTSSDAGRSNTTSGDTSNATTSATPNTPASTTGPGASSSAHDASAGGVADAGGKDKKPAPLFPNFPGALASAKVRTGDKPTSPSVITVMDNGELIFSGFSSALSIALAYSWFVRRILEGKSPEESIEEVRREVKSILEKLGTNVDSSNVEVIQKKEDEDQEEEEEEDEEEEEEG